MAWRRWIQMGGLQAVREGRRMVHRERVKEEKMRETERREKVEGGWNADARGYWRVESLLEGRYGRHSDGKLGLFAKLRWRGGGEERGERWSDEWVHCALLNGVLRKELSQWMKDKREKAEQQQDEAAKREARTPPRNKWPKRQRTETQFYQQSDVR